MSLYRNASGAWRRLWDVAEMIRPDVLGHNFHEYAPGDLFHGFPMPVLGFRFLLVRLLLVSIGKATYISCDNDLSHCTERED